MRNLDDPHPAAGPETLDGDMRPADIADALARLRFYDGMEVIAIDREARNYLLAAVRARIGEHSKWHHAGK
jgi:hypothetical protein